MEDSKLNGKLVNDACAHASGQEAVISYEQMDPVFINFDENCARYLDEQLHYTELCKLLVDYRAALETLCDMLGGRELQIIGEILRDRGASLGAWESQKEERKEGHCEG